MDTNTKNLRSLKGVGENREKLFNKLGINSIDLLLCHYPRKYEDFSVCQSPANNDIVDNALYRLLVTKKHPNQRLFGGRTVTRIEAVGDGVDVTLVYFNNPYTPDSLKVDNEYLFFGKLTKNLIACEMNNPWLVKEHEVGKLLPIYSTTEGLTSYQIAKTVSIALAEFYESIEETLSPELLKEYDLISRKEAIKRIHQPVSYQDVRIARKRLIFEELLVLLLGMLLIREKTKQKTSVYIPDNISSTFISNLPFELTEAQLRCVQEILSDLVKITPMRRLLQGDVGSGKTVVAAVAVAAAVDIGFQVAIMVPTEILAEQHYRTFRSLLSPYNITIELLTGSVKGNKRKQVLKNISDGTAKVVIGTHALISKDVVYNNLGLVITDEQHRFGVEQRENLSKKGLDAHLLVMSATPIPRTLALIIYGDLDVSVIDELPPGRIPQKTYFVNNSYRSRYLNFVKEQVDNGHQVYIVCSLVDENETLDDRLAATEYKKQLEEEYLKGYTIGLIHGRMKASEKEHVMKQFSSGDLSILVSTTVIEVGLDVPNANTMIIENAENYGLSTLHQLRGRIGRGSDESYCILVSNSNDKNTMKRLNIMTKTTSGFEIAKHDLKMRGPGEILGRRQHGLPQLRIADLVQNEVLVTYISNAARRILKEDPRLYAHKHLKRQINEMFSSLNSQPN